MRSIYPTRNNRNLYESSNSGSTGAGSPGPIGPQGPEGPAGINGLNGATGPTGSPGVNGLNGTNGAIGPIGPAGAVGPAGPAGTDGLNGTVGATGPRGLQGIAGTAGTNGTNGAVGPTGPAGAVGPAGTNGTNGAIGPTGPAGAIGPAGTNGTNGTIGPTGPVGSIDPTSTVTLSNKSLIDASTFIIDDLNSTKRLRFECTAITAGQTRVINMIDADITPVGLINTQTLTNKTLTDATNNVTANSLRSATTTVTVNSATAPSSGQVLTATSSTNATWQTPINSTSTNTLSNKSFIDSSTFILDDVDNTKRLRFEVSPVATAQTRVITAINENLTLVGLSNDQILSNKSFSSDILPVTDDTVSVGNYTTRMTNILSHRLNIGPNQTITGSVRTILTGADRNQANGPHIRSYTALDTFPLHEQLNFGHDDVWYIFDSYFDGSAFRSSHNSSTYAIQKTLGSLRFNSSPATIAGNTKTWTNRAILNERGFDNIQFSSGGTIQFNNVGATNNITISAQNATSNVNYILPFTTLGTPTISVVTSYSGSVLSNSAIVKTFSVNLEKHNNIVHCKLSCSESGTIASTNFIYINSIIPVGYRPSVQSSCSFMDSAYYSLCAFVLPTGVIVILRYGPTPLSVNFTAGDPFYPINTNFTWSTV